MFSKGESRSPGDGDRSRRLGSGARMTGCRDLTRVGEMGTDGGWYGPCGPHRYPSLSLPPFGVFSSSNQGHCTRGGRGGLEELRAESCISAL